MLCRLGLFSYIWIYTETILPHVIISAALRLYVTSSFSFLFYFFTRPFILFLLLFVEVGGGEAFNMITNDAAHRRERRTVVRFVSVPQGRGHGSSSICKEQGGAPFHQAVDLLPTVLCVCVCVCWPDVNITNHREQLFFGRRPKGPLQDLHIDTREYSALIYIKRKRILTINKDGYIGL